MIIYLHDYDRIMTQGFDDYGLPIPYFQFHKMVWDWRLDKFQDYGIRIKAAIILGRDIDLHRILGSGFLPSHHQQCRTAMERILYKDYELITEEQENFLKEHWKGELLPHMLKRVESQSVQGCLRSGCGVILALLLRNMPYKELTESFGSFGISGSPTMTRCIKEVDVLFNDTLLHSTGNPLQFGNSTSCPSWGVQSGSSSTASSDCISS